MLAPHSPVVCKASHGITTDHTATSKGADSASHTKGLPMPALCLALRQPQAATIMPTSTHCIAPVRDTEHATPAANTLRHNSAKTQPPRVMLCALICAATQANNATSPRLVSEANWLR